MGINERIDKLQNRLDFFYDKDIAFQIDMLKAIRDAREEIAKEVKSLNTEDGDFNSIFNKGQVAAHLNDLNILDKHIEAVESKYE